MDGPKLFTKEEVVDFAKQNPEKLILSIHDNIYDVTKFADEHPGGEEALKEQQIKEKYIDSTNAFEDIGHSMDARGLLKKFEIGKLPSGKAKTEKASTENKAEAKEGCALCNWYIWLIPVVVIGLALYFRNTNN